MQCLVSNDEVGLIVFEKNLQIANAISGTRLNKLEKTIGEIGTITAICYLLNRFNATFNVGKSLTMTQAALLASDIVEKYPYETIEDIVLLLKHVRQGHIGDGKDYKLDGQNFMTKWLPEYLDKKYLELERINQREIASKSNEENIQKNAVQQFYEKRNREKLAEIKKQQMRSDIDEMVKNMDRQMLEDTISDWQKKPEMKFYIDYLISKRREVKGEYRP